LACDLERNVNPRCVRGRAEHQMNGGEDVFFARSDKEEIDVIYRCALHLELLPDILTGAGCGARHRCSLHRLTVRIECRRLVVDAESVLLVLRNAIRPSTPAL